MASYLDKIKLELSLEDYRNLLEYVLNKQSNQSDLEQYKGTYESFRSIVPEDFNTECLDRDKFIVNFFNRYVTSMSRRDMSDPRNEVLKHDYEIISTSDSFKNISSARELFSLEEFKQLNFKPIYPQDEDINSRFVHVQGSYLGNYSSEDIQCRIYMCPQMKNITKLAEKIISKHLDKSLPCYFKFNENYKDNDRLVLYCSKASLEAHMQIIEEIKAKYPELFDRMGKNPLWGNIEGVDGIYCGMEPVLNGGSSSYGNIRAVIFDNSISSLKSLYPDMDFSNMQISNDMVNDFKNIFELNCLAHNIDPKNIALNKDPNALLDQPIMLQTSDEVEVPVWVNGINVKKMTATISSPLFNRDKENLIEITKDELDLLYKREKNATDYEQSELVRSDIVKRIQRLHIQNKIDGALEKVNPVAQYKQKMIVQESFDGKVIVGNYHMNKTLYKLLPQKLSFYLAKKLEQRKNTLKGECDVLLDDEIAELGTEISSAGVEQKKQAEQVIANNIGQQHYEVGKPELPIINNNLANYSDVSIIEETPGKSFR